MSCVGPGSRSPAVAPGMGPEEWSRRSSPVSDMLYRLDQIIAKVPAARAPLSSRLSVHHSSSLARDWQGAARSTVLSELVLPAAVVRARSEQQRLVILKDAVDVFHGLVRLDRLYRLVDGWRRLPHVDLAAERAIEMARDLAAAPRDHWIDRFQAPTPGAIEGPLLPGIPGATQAQHNVEIYLRRPTSAIALRAVLKKLSSRRFPARRRSHANTLARTRTPIHCPSQRVRRPVSGRTRDRRKHRRRNACPDTEPDRSLPSERSSLNAGRRRIEPAQSGQLMQKR